MNEFRKALDAHVAGRLELSDLEREIHLALAHQPELAAAHGALVEALYRSNRIKGETYLALTGAIRTFLKSQARVEVRVTPPGAATPGAGTEEKTQFRAPKPAGPAAPGPAPAAEAEKTQFRPPRAPGSATPAGPGASAPAAAPEARVAPSVPPAIPPTAETSGPPTG